MSRRLRVLNFFLKWLVRPVLSRISSKNPSRLRPWLDKPMEWGFRPARGAVISEAEISGVSVMNITNGKSSNGTLFYLHGGAYVFGSARTHRKLVAHICGLCGLTGLSVNYRLAPEHPFPAAIDDAFSVYQGLLALGAKNIIISGDSAGGGLALALLAKILKNGLPPPKGLVAFSPWCDLTLSGKSMVLNDKSEYLLPPNRIREARDFYAQNDTLSPLASPLFANFAKAPPVLILVGNGEVLLDDSTRMAKKLRDQNVDVQLTIYENTPHVWVMGHGKLPEANRAIKETSDYINRVLQS